MNDRFVIKRGWNQVCMFIVTIAAILLLCAKQQILLDQIFFIEHDRAEGLISHNRETDFKKVLYSYTAAAVVVVFASYFPGFVKPLVFVPLIIAAFVSERLALITGIFWDSMICLVMGLHSQELILYCLLTIFGVILAGTAEEAAKQGKKLIWYEVLLFCRFTSSHLLLSDLSGGTFCAFIMGNWRGCHQCFVAAVWLSAFLTFEGTGSK